MYLKKSWSEVTIAEYTDYLELIESPNYSELGQFIQILSLFSDEKPEYFEQKTPSEVRSYFKNELAYLSQTPDSKLKNYYKIGKNRYKLVKRVQDLTAGQLIDLETANKDEDARLDTLPQALATVLLPHSWRGTEKYGRTPLKETQDNILLNMSIADAMAISVFFCEVLANISAVIKASFRRTTNRKLKSVLKILKRQKPSPLRTQAIKETLSLIAGDGLPA